MRHIKIAKLVIQGTADAARAVLEATDGLERVSIERSRLPPVEPGATTIWILVAGWRPQEGTHHFADRVEAELEAGGIRVLRRTLRSHV